jgi:hypothetical protein
MKRNVLDLKAVDESMCVLRIRTRFQNVSFTNVHASTEENKAFYHKVEVYYSSSTRISLIRKLLRGVASVFAGHATRLDWQVATKVVTYRRVIWVIDLFSPHKSPGMDWIFPALLQEGREVLVPYPVRIFHACLVIGYVPTTRRQAVFISKPGRDSYGGPKDYRPISLTLLLLKTMERHIDF